MPARKRTRRDFKSQADALFAAAIRSIGYCEECGARGEGAVLQCAHILSRSYNAVRTDFRNAVALCRACHFYYTPRPLQWEDWARERIGTDLYDELRRKAVASPPVDWPGEVLRLRTDVPDLRGEPLGRRLRP